MLRVNEICVKKKDDSRITFSAIKECIDDVMQKNASAIMYKVIIEDKELKVFLQDSISLQTANKFVKAFDQKRMRLMRFALERKELGPFKKGCLEIIVF